MAELAPEPVPVPELAYGEIPGWRDIAPEDQELVRRLLIKAALRARSRRRMTGG